MPAEPPTTWMLLTVDGESEIVVTTELRRGDDRLWASSGLRKTEYTLARSSTIFSPTEPPLFPTVADAWIPIWLPAELVPRVTERAGPEPWPVFVSAKSANGRLLREKGLLQALIRRATSAPPVPSPLFAPFIWLAEREYVRRVPLFLPLRVAAVGGAFDFLSGMRNRSWYSSTPAVPEHGLVLSDLSLWTFRDKVRYDAFHVVICDTSSVREVVRVCRDADLNNRPRLVVVIDRESSAEGWNEAVPTDADTPPGVSILWLPLERGTDAGEVVRLTLYAVVHDQPLHGVLSELSALIPLHLREYPRSGPDPVLLREPPRLLSDPFRLNDLRLRDVVEPLLDRIANLESRNEYPGELERFLERVGLDAPERLRVELRLLADEARPLTALISSTSYLSRASFLRESDGLVPLAQNVRDVFDSERVLPSLRQWLGKLAADKDFRRLLERHQERRVNVALRRRDPSSFPSPYVLPEHTLRFNARYRVEVQIGRRGSTSLVEESAPPIDPLLPEPDPARGHVLHVALFALDFTLESPPLQRLLLPPLGGSEWISFDVVAPVAAGPARLRVAVYYDLPPGAEQAGEDEYRNHLIQSFLLEAAVAEEEREADGGTRVRLEFCRTKRLADFTAMAPRKLSIGLNTSGDGTTHTVMVKRGRVTGEFRITEAAMSKTLRAVRGVLDEATREGNEPRFPEASGPAERAAAIESAERATSFDEYVRKLAREGEGLYEMLWEKSPAVFQTGVLDYVRNAADAIIQVARFSQNYFFPWAVVYDFDTPENVHGPKEAEVCRGFRREHSPNNRYSCRECLDNCLHKDKSEAFCVYGFWGLRHQVEQVLHPPFKQEDAIRTVKAGANPASAELCVAVGVNSPYAQSLGTDLINKLGAPAVRQLDGTRGLLDLLWDDKERPRLTVVLGHYETLDKVNEPKGPRVRLPGGQWLQYKEVLKLAQKKSPLKWTDPNPIVLLAVCGSAAEDLGTLAGFVGAFADSRAAAVVGTETVVFDGLAARFSKGLVLALFRQNDPQTLGRAVLDLRRELVAELNPLGLVFTPYGDAELVVEPHRNAAPAAVPAATGG